VKLPMHKLAAKHMALRRAMHARRRSAPSRDTSADRARKDKLPRRIRSRPHPHS